MAGFFHAQNTGGHYKQYSKLKELAQAEDEARNAKKGLWADKIS